MELNIVVFTMLVDGETSEVDMPAGPELWLYRSGDIDGRPRPQIC